MLQPAVAAALLPCCCFCCSVAAALRLLLLLLQLLGPSAFRALRQVTNELLTVGEPSEPSLQIAGGAALKETEVDKQLTARRAAQEGFIELSFPTIAGALVRSVTNVCSQGREGS